MDSAPTNWSDILTMKDELLTDFHRPFGVSDTGRPEISPTLPQL